MTKKTMQRVRIEALDNMEKDHDAEIGEFQNEVRNLVIKLSGAPCDAIDGKGSDAGWQEFTLCEIGQGFSFLKEELERCQKQIGSCSVCGYIAWRDRDETTADCQYCKVQKEVEVMRNAMAESVYGHI